tara:strand:- start:198 stop:548 length:351 start_codon:yes stop_codon:yes gene_type:complete
MEYKIFIKKTYSVSNDNYVQFYIDLSDGQRYSVFYDDGHYNAKHKIGWKKSDDGTMVLSSEMWSSCFTFASSVERIGDIKHAIWLIANGQIDVDDYSLSKPITKYKINKVSKQYIK